MASPITIAQLPHFDFFFNFNNLEIDQLVNHPPCKKRETLGLTNTLETIRKMRNGDKKEAKLMSFLEKLSKQKATPEVLLISAEALEQIFESRHI